MDTATFAWLFWAALTGCLGLLAVIIILTEWQRLRIEKYHKAAHATQAALAERKKRQQFFVMIAGQRVAFGPPDPTPEELKFLQMLAEMSIDPRITRIH